VRSYYIDKHSKPNSRPDNSIPLYREILVFPCKQGYELRQLNLADLRIDQENDESGVDELYQEHLYDTRRLLLCHRVKPLEFRQHYKYYGCDYAYI
jgi:hypothetical protein